jgi:hypothetical protein
VVSPWPARRIVEPALVAAALATAYLLVQPLTADHAAQEFRAELFAREGLGLWNNLWFGGHHLPGYSLLSPALGALIGPRLLGGISAVAAAIVFAAIAKRRWGEVGLAAVLAAQREYRRTAIGLAAATALASPVAALFLACGGLAYWLAERRREAAELAVAAFGTALLMALAFPEGGSEPFVSSSFTPAFLLAIAVFVALPRDQRILRTGVAVYGLVLLGAYLVDNPLGGNATRLGALFLGPLLACALWPRDRVVLALLAPLLVFWQWSPVVRDLEQVHAEPSVGAEYFEPLRTVLARESGGRPTRVEVLPMADHWESAHVPKQVSIARGWERQLDRKLNPLFYRERLSAAGYRRWLDRLGVAYVAVPDGPLDYAAESEAALIDRGPPYLERVNRTENWTVYRVRDPAPLVTPPAELVRIFPGGFVLRARRPGTSRVRIHHTPYWSVTNGVACVEEAADGFTRVRIERPGRVRVAAPFAPWRALGDGRSCRREP